MYDKSLSIFSPEGTLSQVEYANEAVKHGGLSIGVCGKGCIIIAAERKAAPKLQDQRTIRKIGKIDKHISMAFAGIVADSRSLADFARLESQSFRYSLDTPPTVEYVAKQVAFRKQDYTQKKGVRPFGLATIICGFDEGSAIPKLFVTDPAGQITMWKASAIGKNAEKVIGLLENGYKEDMTQEECLNLTVESMLQYVETGSKNMEVAIMLPGQLMQILPDEKVDELIKQIEDKKKEEAAK